MGHDFNLGNLKMTNQGAVGNGLLDDNFKTSSSYKQHNQELSISE